MAIMPNFGKSKGSMMPDMPGGGSKKLSAPPPSMDANEPDSDEDGCECPMCGSKLKLVAAGGGAQEPDTDDQQAPPMGGKGGM